MPGMYCAVYDCKNNSHKKNSKNLSFHRFPKATDRISKIRRNKWIDCCKREDSFNADISYMCSDHFSEDDFERDLKNELLGLPLRKILKKTAVPTLDLCNENPSGLQEESIKIEKEEVTEPFEELFLPSAPDQLIEESVNTEYVEVCKPEPQFESPNYETMHRELLHKYNKLEKRYTTLKANHARKTRDIKKLHDQLRYFKKKYYECQSPAKADIYSVLKSIFSQNQIDILLKRLKKAK